MTKRIASLAVFTALALFLMTGVALATPACDNFGQDWDINLGAFGGTFPGTLLVSGCRDCNNSLGCGGSLPLDGAAVITQGAGGSPYTVMFSMTAYRPSGSSCVSTHWTGGLKPGNLDIRGNVSNEFGPFGAFTITYLGSCRESGASALDPSNSTNGRWAGGGDSSGNKMIVPE